MVDRVNASQTAQTCKALDIAEHQRLLYVSLTRARDLMVLALPERKSSGEWMETLNAPWMIPTEDALTLPDGKSIKTAARVLEEPTEVISSETQDSESFWFGPRTTPHEKLSLLIRPHAEAPAENAVAKLVKKTGAGIGVVQSPDAETLGQALHAVIAAETVNPSSEDALEVTKRIIETHGLDVHLEPQGVLGAVRAFLKFVQREFSPQRLWAEYPITRVLGNGQIVKGWIDLLIETDGNWVIIDHKSSTQNENRLKETSLKYSGQLFCYKEAVEAASGKKADCWIHYPVSGHLVSLEYQS
jgi:ATP-dependent exoDNAse (exonuclease V) beta subunit